MVVRLTPSRAELREKYDAEADRLFAALTIEDIMEAKPQAIQKQITQESFDQIKLVRPDIHVLSEMAVLYPLPGTTALGNVCPDNMVCIFDGVIEAVTNFSVELEEAEPYLMFENVSVSNPRNDYVVKREKYERDLEVPYYLLFDPVKQKLDVLHLNSRGVYANLRRNAQKRFSFPDLEVEIGLLDGWVRYWFRGQLVPRTTELKQSLELAEAKVRRSADAAKAAESAAKVAERDKELAEDKMRRLADRLRALGESVD